MKYQTLAAGLMLAASAPAAAMTIDADERELYDDSVQCMAFYGIMAGLGGGKERGTERGIADLRARQRVPVGELVQVDVVQADLNKQIALFGKLAERPDDPANIEKLRGIKDSCEFMETLVDAMIEGSS